MGSLLWGEKGLCESNSNRRGHGCQAADKARAGLENHPAPDRFSWLLGCWAAGLALAEGGCSAIDA